MTELLFNWIPYNLRIPLLGVSFLGASAGIIGCFALLRKRALTGDALSHAALPGLCLAFVVVGDRNLSAMLVGALITGLLGILVIAALGRWTRIKDDAAVGIVLGVFFGAGIVLSSVIQKQPGGSKAGLESFILGKTASMIDEDLALCAGLFACTLLLMLLLFKEFKLIAFDADFAQVQGWPARMLDLLLMVLIAAAVVIGLPAVGVVLMAALLILPAVAARFWTEKLSVMLVLAGVFGAVAAISGTFLSDRLQKLPAGPSIILCGTGLFLLSLLFAPRRGVLARLWARRRLAPEQEPSPGREVIS